MKKRILYISHTAVESGAELALLRLIRYLDLNRYEPVALFFADGAVATKLRAGGTEVHCLPLEARMNNASRHSVGFGLLLQWKNLFTVFRQIIRVSRFIKNSEIDLVHTFSLKASVIGGFAALATGKFLVWHVHDRMASDYLPGAAITALKFLARRVPDVLIANSISTLTTFLPNPPKKCEVIYPGVDIVEYPIIPASRACEEFRVVGLVGRISRTKGQDIFIKAAAIVAKKYSLVRFQIVGAALFNAEPYAIELQSLASSLGIADKIEFVGFCENISERIGRMTMLVHASTIPEPFGQVVIEGMAAMRPVIATDAGGIREIVVNGETGWLVPPSDEKALADRICWNLEHPVEASAMGARGRQRVIDSFEIHRTVENTQAVYDGIFQNAGVN